MEAQGPDAVRVVCDGVTCDAASVEDGNPIRFYPYFWGHAQERGEGAGLGFNLNLPLPRGAGDDDYLRALDRALDRVALFGADVLVVALGLDAHEADPLKGLAVCCQTNANQSR